MKILTEQQWWVKANRHRAWYAAWRAEIAALEATIDEGLSDVEALQRILDRAETIEKRSEQLERIMVRHIQRAPGLIRSLALGSQSKGRVQ